MEQVGVPVLPLERAAEVVAVGPQGAHRPGSPPTPRGWPWVPLSEGVPVGALVERSARVQREEPRGSMGA